MYLIAIGLIFVFFYININLTGMAPFGFPANSVTVDILPDIVGYALIAYNSYKLRDRSWSFQTALWVSCVMGVYSTVARIWKPTGLLGLVITIGETAGTVWLLKLLTDGVSDIEDAEKRSLRWASLDRWRLLAAVGYIAVLLCTVGVQFISGLGFFSLLVVVLWAVFCVGFTVCFFRTAARCSGGGKNGGKKKYISAPLPPHEGK